MKFIVFISLLVVYQLTFAQSITGRVVDERYQSIPYAHLRVKGTYEGTTTNEEGRFQIYTAVHQPVLVVTSIGFEKREIAVKGSSHLIIHLKSAEKYLSEVVVKPKDYALKLVKAAINNIPYNYPDTTEYHTAFFRQEAVSANGQSPYYLVEMQLGIEKPSYAAQQSSKGRVKMLQSRKMEFQSMDSLAMMVYGGGHFAFWADLVARRAGPLNIPNTELYWYEIADTLIVENEYLFIVKFEPRQTSKVEGRGVIYIHDKNFAVSRMEMEYYQEELKNLQEQLRGYQRSLSSYIVDYIQCQDHWRLSQILYSTLFDKGEASYLLAEGNLIVTNITKDFDPIPYPESIDYFDIMINEVGEYDSTFWKDENTLLPDSKFEQMLQSYPLREIDSETKMERLIKVIRRMFWDFSIESIATNLSRSDVHHEQILTETMQYQQYIDLAYRAEMGYHMNEHWRIGYLGKESLSGRKYVGNWLNLSYQLNLLPNRRPIYLIPSLAVGYQKFMNHLETIQPEKDLSINDKTFDAAEVDVYVAERSLSVMPGLQLLFEKNHRWKFYLSADYNWTLFPTQGLYFQEDEWFGKKAFLKASEPDLAIDFTEELLFENNWQLGVGLSYRF